MKFRKKPVVIEAIQWNGPQDNETLQHFAGHWVSITNVVRITTPEGTMIVSRGDWIIRGIQGEFYPPCKPNIFAAIYEPI